MSVEDIAKRADEMFLKRGDSGRPEMARPDATIRAAAPSAVVASARGRQMLGWLEGAGLSLLLALAFPLAWGQSCSTTLKSELLILSGSSPSYSMKPSFLNLFRRKFTRERVVPTISASVSCEIFGTTRIGLSCFP